MTSQLRPLPAIDGSPLATFVQRLSELLEGSSEESEILDRGGRELGALVERDDWLGEAWTTPDPVRYRQNLLYCEPQGRFSVVSFVWGPGQSTPVHDHRTWGLIGMMRGAEDATTYELEEDGALRVTSDPIRLRPGQVDAVSPTIGDIHRVRNAFEDRPSVSIHVYGANIGKVSRHVYPEGGGRKDFVSGYSDLPLPNPWAPAA